MLTITCTDQKKVDIATEAKIPEGFRKTVK